MWAVIPVKRLELSKQRLAGVLTAPQRVALMTAMIEDVLTALAKVHGLAGYLLVTRDEHLCALATRFGAEVLREQAPIACQQQAAPAAANGEPAPSRDELGSPESGLCRALDEAACYLRNRGARGMLIVPGDVPLIDAVEIDALLARHRNVTIVPDRASGGTNALLLSPPGTIAFHFGVDSCRRHEQSATAAGLSADVVRLASLELDVDTVEDLAQLRIRGAGTRAHAVLTNIAAANFPVMTAATTAATTGATTNAARPVSNLCAP